MTLITRQGKGSKLTIQEMDGNFEYLEQIAQEGGGLEGTQYLFVAANGTDVENAAELQAAYDLAKTMSPSADNRITVIASPGNYKFPSTFVMDTEFIDLVSLTGNRDVIFDLDGITDPFIEDINGDIQSVSECLLIDADNVFVKGIKGKSYLSPNWDNWWFDGDGQKQDYILPIQISNNLPNIVVENCQGGIFSFGSDITFGSNPIILSGKFINCLANDYSFAGSGQASGVFIDCYYGASSAGTKSTGEGALFGADGQASGVFINCSGNSSSFGGQGSASGTFTNCIGGLSSFGNNGGTLSGKLFYCRLTSGTFETVSGGGVTVLCIDGNNQINTQN
jgi:hypothetical protein